MQSVPFTIDSAASADVLIAPHGVPLPEEPPEDDEDDVDEEDDDVADGDVGDELLLPPHAANTKTEAPVSAANAARRHDEAFICQLAFLSVPAEARGGSTVTAQAQATSRS